MGVWDKIFSRKKLDTRTALARWVDTLKPKDIEEGAKDIDPKLKSSYAIAITVFKVARGFMQALDKMIQDMPEPFRVKHPIAHDKMFSEVASFCYFAISAEAYPVQKEKKYIDEHYDDEDDPMDSDPYYSVIRQSALLAGEVLHQVTEIDRAPEFLANRAFGYRHKVIFGKDVNLVEEFMQNLWEQWIPDEASSGGITLDLANPGLVLTPLITKLPLDELEAQSRYFYTKFK